ncbi:MAG: hypothetical protein ACRDQA_08260, partial [Nocardioidaceae bacterium]
CVVSVEAGAIVVADFLRARYEERSRELQHILDGGGPRWGPASEGEDPLSRQLHDAAAKRTVVDRLMWILGHSKEPAVISIAERNLSTCLRQFGN